MNISPRRVINLALKTKPQGIKVMTSTGIRRPNADSYIPYHEVLGGNLAEARGTELPFMVPVIDPVRCWHWDEVTVFTDSPLDELRKWHVRLVIETDDHMFIYALKPLTMNKFIESVIEANREIGRLLLVGHESDGNMAYTTLKTDKIKTRN